MSLLCPSGSGVVKKRCRRGPNGPGPARIALAVGRPIWPPPAAEGGRFSRRVVQEFTDRLHAELQEVFDTAQALAGV